MAARNPELTPAQATDLARHFLGGEWRAADCGAELHLIGVEGHYIGRNWREVFRSAGIKLPARSEFSAQKERIMQDDKCVAVACSANFARRTVNALNEYETDRRGL